MTENTSITEEKGDIFNAPANTLLVHACNCYGSWDAGVALSFKNKYPEAYEEYHKYCKANKPDKIVGTALIIPVEDERQQFIGCMFTSRMYGRYRDKDSEIFKSTESAFKDLLEQIKDNEKIEQLWMCKINSGMFGIRWTKTRSILRDVVSTENTTKPIKIISLT